MSLGSSGAVMRSLSNPSDLSQATLRRTTLEPAPQRMTSKAEGTIPHPVAPSIHPQPPAASNSIIASGRQWPSTASRVNDRFLCSATLSDTDSSHLQISGSKQQAIHLQAFRVLRKVSRVLPLLDMIDTETAMRSVENSSSFAFLKKFPSPSQLYVVHKDRKVGDTFLAECGPYFVFYDNLARLLRPKEEPVDTHERQPTAPQPQISNLATHEQSAL